MLISIDQRRKAVALEKVRAGAGCVLLVLVMFLIESIKDYRDGIKSYDEGDDL